MSLWKCVCVTAWKVSPFGVFLVRIFPHSDWIRRDTAYRRIQFKCGKKLTRKAPNADTFHAIFSYNFAFVFAWWQDFTKIIKKKTFSLKYIFWFLINRIVKKIDFKRRYKENIIMIIMTKTPLLNSWAVISNFNTKPHNDSLIINSNVRTVTSLSYCSIIK